MPKIYDIYKIPRGTKVIPIHSYTDRRLTPLGELVKRYLGRKTLAYLQKLEKSAKSYS